MKLACPMFTKLLLSGTEPEPETGTVGTVGTVFPETESGNRTRRTVFRNRNRPFLLNWTETQKTLFAEEPSEPKPEPREPFHLQTVTEPNRTGASLFCSFLFPRLAIALAWHRGANCWGQKGHSQEFVFPSFWPSSRELLGVNSYSTPLNSLRKGLDSTLLFQPQTVTPHKQHTPIEHLARGRLWVDSWSVSVKNDYNRPKPTENRLKTDPPQDPDSWSTP